jgi:hypothetical protein
MKLPYLMGIAFAHPQLLLLRDELIQMACMTAEVVDGLSESCSNRLVSPEAISVKMYDHVAPFRDRFIMIGPP